MQRLSWVLAASAVYCSYSFSEVVTQTSPDPITGSGQQSYNWTMDQILPDATGLTVHGIEYGYTVDNDGSSLSAEYTQMNAESGGLMVYDYQDWTGKEGGEFNDQTIITPGIPRQYWGDGAIVIEGDATRITNPYINYTYTYDTCQADPLSSPTCPGYDQLVSLAPTEDSIIQSIIAPPIVTDVTVVTSVTGDSSS